MSRPGVETESPYLMIANDIQARVRAGDLRSGDRVPSTRQITKEWGVAIATATKALVELSSRGVVRAIPGVGTVVADGPPLPTAKARPRIEAGTQTAASLPGGVKAVRAGSDEINRDRIIQTAIDIADAEGIGALSMRRIAVTMGVATMSLYRWIAGKDDLVVGMMDQLLGDGDWPEPPEGWRAQLEYIARRQWDSYCEHPWLAHVVSLTRPQLAPRAMKHTDWALAALDPHHLDSATRLQIVLTLFGHVKGVANGLAAEREAERETGVDIEEWMRRTDAEFAQYIQSGAYPSLAKIDGNPEVTLDLTELFEFGLTALLDGFAMRIEGARQ